MILGNWYLLLCSRYYIAQDNTLLWETVGENSVKLTKTWSGDLIGKREAPPSTPGH